MYLFTDLHSLLNDTLIGLSNNDEDLAYGRWGVLAGCILTSSLQSATTVPNGAQYPFYASGISLMATLCEQMLGLTILRTTALQSAAITTSTMSNPPLNGDHYFYMEAKVDSATDESNVNIVFVEKLRTYAVVQPMRI